MMSQDEAATARRRGWRARVVALPLARKVRLVPLVAVAALGVVVVLNVALGVLNGRRLRPFLSARV